MIELANVTKCFNSGKPNQFTAVDNVTLNVQQGEITVFKGPSGSGKTSLLTMIGCMARPTSGRFFLRGVAAALPFNQDGGDVVEITSLPERFLNEIRRSTFGFVFQQFNLVKGISVLENVMLPAYPTGEGRGEFRSRAESLIEQFSVSRHAAKRVEQLSGGELQRVAIARALINNPSIIVADEPTAHLDSKLSQEFMEIAGRLKGEGKSVLIASHDPIVYDSPLIDAMVEMRDGMVIGSRSLR
ncbi:MAG: ABC transporter ATP-binding protein [Desulfuromonadaceae bacterium]|nr:ABC transporter ATP-binding protein [Desulfuromonadaceae bacterium]MDD2856945.1 ABC transporter ATP-binding protein [Desulfuromonadaceae bacterium]